MHSFYNHVNKNWLKNNSIPLDQTSWSIFTMLQEKMRHILLELIKTSTNSHIRQFWDASTKTELINSLGIDPLYFYFNQIDQLSDMNQVFELFSKLHPLGCYPLFSFSAETDYKNSKLVIGQLDPSGLGLPDRDYYLDPKFNKIRQQYKQFLEKILPILGHSSKLAVQLFNFEKKLAQLHYTKEFKRNPDNKYFISNTDNHLSNFFTNLDVHNCRLNISNTAYIEFIEKMKFTPILKIYIKFLLLRSFSSSLSEDIYDTFFEFYGKKLKGQIKKQTLEKKQYSLINTYLGELIGKEYVDCYFPNSYKLDVLNMVDNIKNAFEETIDNLDWMGDETKKKAKLKLQLMQVKMGFPDKWTDYSDLSLNDDFFANIVSCRKYNFDKELKKLNLPPDLEEWEMYPHTINAYFHPLRNEIVFPAGILQDPFYIHGDPITNYGAIGCVIGHEITHAFDDSGRKFDAYGNLKDWWTKDDAERFKDRADKIVEQYSKYKLFGELVNGELTQGENIADIGGLKASFKAFMESGIRSETDQKLFFRKFATIWKNLMRKKHAILRISTDVHAPGEFRVDGSLIHVPKFVKLFPGFSKEAPEISIW